MKTPDANEPVVVYSSDFVEAGLVKSLLESEDIPAFLKDEFVGTISPWWTAPGGAGSVRLMVAAKDKEKAREIIEAYEARNRAAE